MTGWAIFKNLIDRVVGEEQPARVLTPLVQPLEDHPQDLQARYEAAAADPLGDGS